MAVDWSEAIYCQESSKGVVMAVNVCEDIYFLSTNSILKKNVWQENQLTAYFTIFFALVLKQNTKKRLKFMELVKNKQPW